MEEQIESTNKKRNTKLIFALIGLVVFILISAGLGFFVYKQHGKMAEYEELVEQAEFDKESLMDEYENLAIELDGYQQLDIHNDSLQIQLVKEQQRIRDLLEELNMTKVTDARRIAELEKELASVRAVLMNYVQQIDSLNRINIRLTEENNQYRQQNQQITQANSQLTEQNTQLSRVVTRASMLEVGDVQLVTFKAGDKKTTILKKIEKLQFTFTIRKNITAETGDKIVYFRIINPEGVVMQKDTKHVFAYENQNIPYSVKKPIVYSGEEQTETIYWNVEEILRKGTYTAEFFIDGSLCGSYEFSFE